MKLSIKPHQLQLSVRGPTKVAFRLTRPPRLILTTKISRTLVITQSEDAGRVIGEVPTGVINGVNATFLALNDFVPESVEVFISGHRLTHLVDYSTVGNRQISLFDSPFPGEQIRINYLNI